MHSKIKQWHDCVNEGSSLLVPDEDNPWRSRSDTDWNLWPTLYQNAEFWLSASTAQIFSNSEWTGQGRIRQGRATTSSASETTAGCPPPPPPPPGIDSMWSNCQRPMALFCLPGFPPSIEKACRLAAWNPSVCLVALAQLLRHHQTSPDLSQARRQGCRAARMADSWLYKC